MNVCMKCCYILFCYFLGYESTEGKGDGTGGETGDGSAPPRRYRPRRGRGGYGGYYRGGRGGGAPVTDGEQGDGAEGGAPQRGRGSGRRFFRRNFR